MASPRIVLALPFLVVLAPIAHLWAQNADVVRPMSVGQPIALMVLATALGFALLRSVFGNSLRSALTVSTVWVPVLTFGHQADTLAIAVPSADEDAIAVPLLVANAIVTGGLVTAVWRAPQLPITRTAEFATLAAAIFVVLSLPPILSAIHLGGPELPTAQSSPSRGEEQAQGPDVYYVVLDGYGRGDVLAELYGYDNSAFLGSLEERGFFIAHESLSNYAITSLSLASTLNMRYLDDSEVPGPGKGDTRPLLRELIHQPEIVHRLRDLGYRYVHFDTMYWATDEAPLADVSYSREGFLESEFSVVFLQTTLPGRFLLDLSPAWHETHLYTLEHLRSVPSLDGPTFTFSHLLLPHPPYVFDREGNVLRHEATLTGGWNDPSAYVEQVRFLNKQLLGLVDEIVARSDSQPIIILQADHGPAQRLVVLDDDIASVYWERMGILNAYLVPADVEARLYPSISPVNSFRVIMSELFDDELELLGDRSFFSWSAPSDSPAVGSDHRILREVTEIVRSKP